METAVKATPQASTVKSNWRRTLRKADSKGRTGPRALPAHLSDNIAVGPAGLTFDDAIGPA